MNSIANLAMVPMQDYLELSNEEGRMNIPATAEGNWGWRISSRYDTPQRRAQILALITRTKRNN
jgi:4-alpha-glucanotransferase